MFIIKKLIFVVLVLCWNPGSLLAFTFDSWNSGMSLDEVLNLSEEKDIAIRREGIIGINNHFDPGESRVYADKARTFYYKTRLVNEPAKVTLLFTGESRLLYEVKIYWQGVNVKKALPGAVEEVLRKKYGNPTKGRKLFSKDKVWHLDEENKLTMTNSGAALQLAYIDLVLEKKDSAEKKMMEQLEKGRGVKKDFDKF